MVRLGNWKTKKYCTDLKFQIMARKFKNYTK